MYSFFFFFFVGFQIVNSCNPIILDSFYYYLNVSSLNALNLFIVYEMDLGQRKREIIQYGKVN